MPGLRAKCEEHKFPSYLCVGRDHAASIPFQDCSKPQFQGHDVCTFFCLNTKMPPGGTSSCLLPCPGEALKPDRRVWTGKTCSHFCLLQAARKVISGSLAVFLLPWQIILMVLPWPVFMITSLDTGQSFWFHLAQVLWCCGSSYLHPCCYALLKLSLN